MQEHESSLGQSVYMTDLYDYLQLDKSNYSKFVKVQILSNPFAIAGKDYSYFGTSEKNKGQRGRFRDEYEILTDFAYKLCMVAKSPVSEKVKSEIVELIRQRKSKELYNSDEVIAVLQMIKIFSIYEYRKLAREKNADNYVQKALFLHPELGKSKGKIYRQFNSWRNEVLRTGKDELEKRVKEYCLIEHKRIPAKFTQDQVLTMFGDYEHIKNAVWDVLTSQNKSEDVIKNICDLAQRMAKEIKPFMERLNQSNLFFEKIDNGEVQKVLNP